MRLCRDRAIEVAKADRGWKEQLLSLMDSPETAARAGLPTYDDVLINTDNGYAILLPMIVAWRVAESRGIISSDELSSICEKQVTLIKAEIARATLFTDFRDLLPLYEAGAAGKGRLDRAGRRAGSAAV